MKGRTLTAADFYLRRNVITRAQEFDILSDDPFMPVSPLEYRLSPGDKSDSLAESQLARQRQLFLEKQKSMRTTIPITIFTLDLIGMARSLTYLELYHLFFPCARKPSYLYLPNDEVQRKYSANYIYFLTLLLHKKNAAVTAQKEATFYDDLFGIYSDHTCQEKKRMFIEDTSKLYEFIKKCNNDEFDWKIENQKQRGDPQLKKNLTLFMRIELMKREMVSEQERRDRIEKYISSHKRYYGKIQIKNDTLTYSHYAHIPYPECITLKQLWETKLGYMGQEERQAMAEECAHKLLDKLVDYTKSTGLYYPSLDINSVIYNQSTFEYSLALQNPILKALGLIQKPLTLDFAALLDNEPYDLFASSAELKVSPNLQMRKPEELIASSCEESSLVWRFLNCVYYFRTGEKYLANYKQSRYLQTACDVVGQIQNSLRADKKQIFFHEKEPVTLGTFVGKKLAGQRTKIPLTLEGLRGLLVRRSEPIFDETCETEVLSGLFLPVRSLMSLDFQACQDNDKWIATQTIRHYLKSYEDFLPLLNEVHQVALKQLHNPRYFQILSTRKDKQFLPSQIYLNKLNTQHQMGSKIFGPEEFQTQNSIELSLLISKIKRLVPSADYLRYFEGSLNELIDISRYLKQFCSETLLQLFREHIKSTHTFINGTLSTSKIKTKDAVFLMEIIWSVTAKACALLKASNSMFFLTVIRPAFQFLHDTQGNLENSSKIVMTIRIERIAACLQVLKYFSEIDSSDPAYYVDCSNILGMLKDKSSEVKDSEQLLRRVKKKSKPKSDIKLVKEANSIEVEGEQEEVPIIKRIATSQSGFRDES